MVLNSVSCLFFVMGIEDVVLTVLTVGATCAIYISNKAQYMKFKSDNLIIGFLEENNYSLSDLTFDNEIFEDNIKITSFYRGKEKISVRSELLEEGLYFQSNIYRPINIIKE